MQENLSAAPTVTLRSQDACVLWEALQSQSPFTLLLAQGKNLWL